MQATLISISLFILISCTPPPPQSGTEKSTDSTEAQLTTDSLDVSAVAVRAADTSKLNFEVGDYYSNVINPITISKESKLYEKPDTNSKVLFILPFGTHLHAGRGPTQDHSVSVTRTHDNGKPYTYTQYRQLRWYNATLPEGKGYVKATDVASHSFSDSERGVDYFVITDASREHNSSGALICIYDRNKQMLIDSLRIENWIQVVKFFNSVPWSNVNMLIRASKISGECGGYGGTHIIADVNGKLTEIISSSYVNNEDDTEENLISEVLLPVKTHGGKFVMAENGDTVYRSPFHFKDIPNLPVSVVNHIEELVIKKSHLYQPVFNARNEPVIDSAGNIKQKETHKDEFYRWNGHRLVRLN